ncbi:hypothetical protein ACFQVA_10085 [Actinomadura keratinilytica]
MTGRPHTDEADCRLVHVDPRPEQVQLPRPRRARPHLEEQRLLPVGRGLTEAAGAADQEAGDTGGVRRVVAGELAAGVATKRWQTGQVWRGWR